MKLRLGTATISYEDDGRALIELQHLPHVRTRELKAASDLDPSGRPISIEILSVAHLFGTKETGALLAALDASGVVYSYDRENDALIVNINAIGEDPSTQRPTMVRFLYDNQDKLAAVEVIGR